MHRIWRRLAFFGVMIMAFCGTLNNLLSFHVLFNKEDKNGRR